MAIERSAILDEKCGVFGIYGDAEAARQTFFGLYALQHRGQKTAGITSSDEVILRTYRKAGLVGQVFTEEDIRQLPGGLAIGHVLYETFKVGSKTHMQPVTSPYFALSHNGNDPDPSKPKAFLEKEGVDVGKKNDSETYHALIGHHIARGASLEDAVKEAWPLMEGAFSLVLMGKDKVAAVRDRFGIRPLSIGKRDNGAYVFASETCALDTVGARFIREVLPGEMVVAGPEGLRRYKMAEPDQKLDIFEFVYFSRPDSKMLGQNVGVVRRNLGRKLAAEHPLEADIVLGVPDSATPAALGYSEASGVPYADAIIKNRYIHRTFITPGQDIREQMVKMKLNVIPEFVKGKSVVLVDDSIVRGTTAPIVIEMLYRTGAKRVNFLSTSDRIVYPDFTGIDTPNQRSLIAYGKSVDEIRSVLGSDYLGYLSFASMIEATGLPESMFYTGQFTGEYPISLGNKAKEFQKAE